MVFNAEWDSAQSSPFELISFNANDPNSTLQTHASGHLRVNQDAVTPDVIPVVELAAVQKRLDSRDSDEVLPILKELGMEDYSFAAVIRDYRDAFSALAA